MRFDIVTLFPEIVQASVQASIMKRASEKGLVEFYFHNIRDFALDSHKTVDDSPYGGGAGMLLKVDVVDATLRFVTTQVSNITPDKRRTILLCPQGIRFTQKLARQIAFDYEQVTLICGHYEGYDERIRSLIDAELSIGDFVVTGGELPAALVIDAVTRLLPEVLQAESPEEESFSLQDSSGKLLLEYPHYTRPLEYNSMSVPEVLRSGNHAAIAKWRQEQAILRTENHEKKDHETI